MPAYMLQDIADELKITLRTAPHLDANVLIRGMATLSKAEPGDVSFLANVKYRRYLSETKASAVILKPEDADACPTHALISKDPYLSYAKLATLLQEKPSVVPGIHPTAVVDATARIHPTACIGPYVVISEWSDVGAGSVVGAGTFVGPRCVIGERVLLHPRVTLYAGVKVGSRSIIHSGAVLGSDGFGFANDAGKWFKIPQKGGVSVGEDVEVGANTTIDCGALDDTLIGDGVKLDNQIQIGHNVRIGAHTIIAGCVGIAGSTEIGSHCAIGGASGIAGHLVIGDQVVITGMSMVTQSVPARGTYSSGTGLMPNAEWLKAVVRFRQSDELFRRVSKCEKMLKEKQVSTKDE